MYIDIRILQCVALYVTVGMVYTSIRLIVGWCRAEQETRDYLQSALAHMALDHGWVGAVGVSLGMLLLLLMWPMRVLKDLGVLKG